MEATSRKPRSDPSESRRIAMSGGRLRGSIYLPEAPFNARRGPVRRQLLELDHHPIGLKGDLAGPHPRQVQQAGECGGDAHGQRPPVRGTQEPTNLRGPRSCASPSQHSRSAIHDRVSPASMPASDRLSQPASSPGSRQQNGLSPARDSARRFHQCKAPAQPPNPTPESPTIMPGAPKMDNFVTQSQHGGSREGPNDLGDQDDAVWCWRGPAVPAPETGTPARDGDAS